VAAHSPSPSSGAFNAAQLVLNGMIQRIRNYATSQGFPACTTNPCAALGLLHSPPPAITNLVIIPAQLVLGVSQSASLTVFAAYNDGSMVDVTASGGYTSGDPGIIS